VENFDKKKLENYDFPFLKLLSFSLNQVFHLEISTNYPDTVRNEEWISIFQIEIGDSKVPFGSQSKLENRKIRYFRTFSS
jgi:hypothetical protein